jgi:hypothetical protein
MAEAPGTPDGLLKSLAEIRSEMAQIKEELRDGPAANLQAQLTIIQAEQGRLEGTVRILVGLVGFLIREACGGADAEAILPDVEPIAASYLDAAEGKEG